MPPFPGISADVIDNEGISVGNGEGGYLVHHRAVARDAAGHLGRPRALP